MRLAFKLFIYLMIFPITYYVISVVISFSKKNEIELTFVYETLNTINNKYLFIGDYLEGKQITQLQSINYDAIQIHTMLDRAGLIKQDNVSHDPTFKCLGDVDVRKFEMYVIADFKMALRYTFTSSSNETEKIDKVIECNRTVFIKSLEKYIVPSEIDIHIKRLENQIKILPKITLDAKDEIDRKYLIQPVSELIEELENLQFAESLLKDNSNETSSKVIKNFIEDSKFKIIMQLKKIEESKIFNLYESSNTFENWLIRTQINRINEVLTALRANNLNLNEINYEIYRTEQNKITNSYSLYIFTFLLGGFIIVLIENIIRSFYKKSNKIYK